MADYAKRNNIDLGNGEIYINSKQIAHATRDSKRDKDLSVSPNDLISFPLNRRNMDLYHESDGFVYTDYNNKFIIKPGYKIKVSRNRIKTVMSITAGKVRDPNEFNQPKYEKV